MRRLLSLFLFSVVTVLSGMGTIDVSNIYKKFRDTETQELMKVRAHYDMTNQPDSALVCYSIVNERLSGSSLSEEEEKIYARSLTNLGFLYGSYYFDYTKAMAFFNKSNQVSEKIGYTSNMAYNYLNMAGVYLSCNQIYLNSLFEDEFWEYSLKCLEAALVSEEWEVALASITNAGMLNLQNPKTVKLTRMIQLITDTGIPEDVNMRKYYFTFMNGSQMYALGEYESALAEYSKLEGMVDVSSMLGPRYLIMAHTSVAYTLAALERYTEAITKTKQYISEAQQAGLSDEMTKGYLCLSEYYKKIGDIGSSSQSLFEYYSKKDSILSAREITGIGNMPLTKQIDSLSVQYQQERESKQRLSIILWIAIPFAVLLLLFVIFLYRARNKEKKYTKEIYRKNVELLKEEETYRAKIGALEDELIRLKSSLKDVPQTHRAPSGGASEERPSSLTTPENGENGNHHEEATQTPVRYQNSQIPEEIERDILRKVNEALDDTAMICDSGFSLSQLAEHTGYSYKQLSQVINDKTGNNFKTMLSERRIKEACRRLIDQKQYGNYTIEHIARSVGFQSRSHFSVCFKTVVGISPSDFQRNARVSAEAE